MGNYFKPRMHLINTMKRQTTALLLLIPILLTSHITFSARAEIGQTQEPLDLILGGNEVRIIANQNLTINGNLQVADAATLKLVNTHLRFMNTSQLELSGGGRIELTNSDFSNLDITYPLLLTIRDDSSLSLRNSSILGNTWCPLHLRYHYRYYIEMYDRSKIEASNSSIGNLILFDSSTAQVNGSYIGSLNYYSSKCQITDTTIDILGITITEDSSNLKIKQTGPSIENATHFEVAGVPGELILREIKLLYFTFINAINCTLTVWDSNPSIIMYTGNQTLRIEDTTTSTLSLYGNPTVEIFDSSVKWITGATDYIRKIHFRNSTIGTTEFSLREEALIESSRVGRWLSNYLVPPGSHTRHMRIIDSVFGNFTVDTNTVYDFENTRVENWTWISPSFSKGEPSYISGEVEFGGLTPISDLVYSDSLYCLVTRQFEVIVLRGGAHQKSAHLELRRGGELVWSGYTDERGSASFNLTFTRIVEIPYQWGVPSIDYDNVTQILDLA